MPAPELSARPLDALVGALASLEGVAAISLGGSTQAGLADAASDLDLHCFWRPPLAPPAVRAAALAPLADAGSLRVGVQSWGLEDQLSVAGTPAEAIYVRLDELQGEVERAYVEGLDGEAFTTALLYSVACGQPLYDPAGTLQAIRARLNAAFPEATYRALLERRTPLLHATLRQIGRAQQRGDLLSVQQKRATFQAIFFNLLFTLNRRYHPGEKRLLQHSHDCPLQPPSLDARWLASTHLAADDPALLDLLGGLAQDLLGLVRDQPGIAPRDEPW